MNYVLILCFSAFCEVLSSAISKLTSNNLGSRGVGIEANLFIITECGLIGALFLYCFNGALPIRITSFTFWMATLSTILVNTTMPFIYKALSIGDISAYKLIITVGCLLLPYAFGIAFLREEITVLAVCGVVILICAIAIPILVEASGKKVTIEKKEIIRFYFYCSMVFVFTSASTIVNKLYWIMEPYQKNSVVEYSFVCYLMGAALAGIILLYLVVIKKRKIVLAGKHGSWFIPLIVGVESVSNALSFYFQMTCVQALPTTLYTPLSTGISLIFTTIMAWIIFREKPTMIRIISIIATILAIWLIHL